ncbi:MAG: DUF748 domain-containing protein [Bacteroidales bacterium]|nr:DUF748 domain-containing protein [Bacteroidales bacterium]
MKRGLKITLWVIGILLAIVFVATLIAAPVAKSYINKHGEELVGRKVNVEELKLNVYTGHVAIHGLSLYEDNGSDVFASFDTLDVKASLLKLLSHTVHLKHITLAGLKVNLIQNGETFNFQSIIDHFASDTTEVDTDTTPSDWVLKFYNIRLSHAQVNYLDAQSGKQWHLPHIGLRVPGFVLGGEEQSEGGLRIGFAEGGRLSIDGNYDSHRGSYQLIAQLENFALQNLQPLTEDILTVDRLGGTLNAGVKAEGTISEILKSYIGGSLTLNGVSLEKKGAEPMAQLRKLEVLINNINLDANSYDIQEVTLEGLQAHYEQWTDHSTLDELLASKESESSESSENSENSENSKNSDNSTPMKLHVGQLSIKDCNVTYSDYTLPDPFHFPVTNLSAEASDLTLAGGNNAKLRATLPGGGHLMVNWKGDLDDWKRHQDLFLSIKGLDMTQLSPWAVAYTAQPIEDGIFGLSTRLNINNSQLDNQNKIDIFKARVGSRRKDVDPEMKVPLKTALYILRDKDDKILIDLPIKGNVDSPEFNYMKLVWKTLGNLLVKVATSPVRALGNALGMGSDNLDFMAIAPGQHGLTSENYHTLSDLATIAKSDSLVVITLEQRMPAPANDSVAFRYTMWNNIIQRYMQEQGVDESQLNITSGEPTADGERTGYAIGSEMKME